LGDTDPTGDVFGGIAAACQQLDKFSPFSWVRCQVFTGCDPENDNGIRWFTP